MQSNQPQPALLFMPDISGFTRFVNDTEVLHGQHIIQELLESLIESDQLGLEVAEVEGDAIFFYRFGAKPDLQSLLNQVEKMFTTFHQHLKLYEHQRICPCGACKSGLQLTLKVVAHFGEVTGISVKEHKKLFGKDVILIHRLLKNNLQKTEYVLLTDSLTGNSVQNDLPEWYKPIEGKEEYDLGPVQFSYSDLSLLYNKIPPAKFPVYNSSANTYVAFTYEEKIDAPIQRTFAALLDLRQHAKLIEGSKKIESITDETISRLGTKHYCTITKNNSVNITESVKLEPGKIELVEMSQKGIAGYRYILNKISPDQTELSIQMLVRKNPFIKLFFLIILRPKFMKRFREFFENLKAYLKKGDFPDLAF